MSTSAGGVPTTSMATRPVVDASLPASAPATLGSFAMPPLRMSARTRLRAFRAARARDAALMPPAVWASVAAIVADTAISRANVTRPSRCIRVRASKLDATATTRGGTTRARGNRRRDDDCLLAWRSRTASAVAHARPSVVGRRGMDLVDPERLARWMDARDLPGRGEPPACRFITGGASNEAFQIRRGDLRLA